MSGLLNIVLTICLLWACSKWFAYCCATKGLLYYLAVEHGELLDAKKARELTDMAAERTIKELFKR